MDELASEAYADWMAGHQILIIEDNPDIAGLLTLDLQDEGYAVHHEATAIAGLTAARSAAPDVILLDLGLPDLGLLDLDGRHVLLRLRKFSAVPVIVLTARGSVEEKVELLTLGADDDLVKPYALAELLARIQVQLRHHRDTVIQLGALELNPLARLALYQGRDLRLTSKEFEILSALMATAGRVIRREKCSPGSGSTSGPSTTTPLTYTWPISRRNSKRLGGLACCARSGAWVQPSAPGPQRDQGPRELRAGRLPSPCPEQ